MSNYSIHKLTKNSSFHALILIFITPFQLIAMQEPSKAFGLFLNQWEANNTYKTALHLALYNKKDEVALFLIKTPGITLCISDDADNTPLHIAVTDNNINIVKALLEKAGTGNDQVHPNDKDDAKNTPLHIAASKGYTDVVKALLEKAGSGDGQVHPSENNNQGDTPLHIAASKGYTDVVQALLEKAGTGDGQVNPNATNNRGDTPHSRFKRLYRRC